MRKLILLLLSLILILSSCELFMDEPEMGDVYVISIGIDYKNNLDSKNNVYKTDDLDGTIPDAKEIFHTIMKISERAKQPWKGYLLLQEGADYDSETLGMYEGEGIGKTNYASKAHLLQTLATIQNQATHNDLTILTYSGHGIDKTGELVLAHTDSDGHTPITDEMMVTPNELLAAMGKIKGRKLIILDSCISGVFVPESESSLSTVLVNGIDDWYAKFWEESGYELPDLYVLTASALTDSYEDPDSADHSHGVFTITLLEALGWNHPHGVDISTIEPGIPPALRGSVITVDSLYTYIKKNQDLPIRWNILKPSQEYQHPLVSGGAMDMVLFRF